MDVYRMLQEILDIHPTGAPASKYFDEILRILFTKEEAELAVHLKFSPVKTALIAEKAGIPEKEASQILEGMEKKSVIFSGEDDSYSLFPAFPGLFKFPLLKIEKDTLKKLSGLWENYKRDGFNDSFACSETPQIRVIPVQSSLTEKSFYNPHEDIKEIIAGASFISLTDCACRLSKEDCASKEEFCMVLEDIGKFLVKNGLAREISSKEALEVLKKAENEGLFHTCNNAKSGITTICSCCSCCCTVLRGETELNNPGTFATSGWLPVWNPILCIHCQNCADNRCPVNAIRVIGNFVDIEEDFCIGCGLCVSDCPERALTLARRIRKPEVPETVSAMEQSILKHKGKAEKYNELMDK